MTFEPLIPSVWDLPPVIRWLVAKSKDASVSVVIDVRQHLAAIEDSLRLDLERFVTDAPANGLPPQNWATAAPMRACLLRVRRSHPGAIEEIVRNGSQKLFRRWCQIGHENPVGEHRDFALDYGLHDLRDFVLDHVQRWQCGSRPLGGVNDAATICALK